MGVSSVLADVTQVNITRLNTAVTATLVSLTLSFSECSPLLPLLPGLKRLFKSSKFLQSLLKSVISFPGRRKTEPNLDLNKGALLFW